ncbi:MAG: hypothetical protein KAG97_06465, partial [Victivallales bacterium]|nr:hypothetical protein [Victivallales bacterium]
MKNGMNGAPMFFSAFRLLASVSLASLSISCSKQKPPVQDSRKISPASAANLSQVIADSAKGSGVPTDETEESPDSRDGFSAPPLTLSNGRVLLCSD